MFNGNKMDQPKNFIPGSLIKTDRQRKWWRSVGKHGGAYTMNRVNVFLAAVACTFFVGCVSQQSHERALQEHEMSKEESAAEIEQLQHMVKEKQIAIVQLQAVKKDLEDIIEVQDQIKNQQLEAISKELEALYAQVTGLEQMPGKISSTGKAIFEVDPMDFDELAKILKNVRSTLEAQMADYSQILEQNGKLEQEIAAMESRLQDMEQLKRELEQVRLGRETQEAQLAKVKREVQTVGEEIDPIRKALEDKFGPSLMVTQHQDRLILTLLGQVLFESGEAELTPLGLQIMKQVGQVLATLPEKYMQVEGHTDNHPIYGRLQQQFPTNWELSTARATTVLRYLIEQTKMSPQDFGATGYADTRPVTTNDTEEGRAQNRRVEIVLYPKQAIQVKEKVATMAQ
jgi:chemotaxis protein MotB